MKVFFRITIIIIFSLTLCISHQLMSQKRFEVGMGMRDEILTTDNVIFITDSVYIFGRGGRLDSPLNPKQFLNNDLRHNLYIGYTFKEVGKFTFHVSLNYLTKWMKFGVVRILPKQYINGVPHRLFPDAMQLPSAALTILSPGVKVAFRPVDFIRLFVGTSPSIVVGVSDAHKYPTRIGKGSRRDPIFEETAYQLQRINKTVTLDYNFGISFDMFKKALSLSIYQQGSIGRVNNDLKVFGKTFPLEAIWKSYGISLAYNFDIQSKKNKNNTENNNNNTKSKSKILFHVGLSNPITTQNRPTYSAVFDQATSMSFSYRLPFYRYSILGSYPLDDKLSLTSGIILKNEGYSSRMKIFQNDTKKSHSLSKDYDYMNITIPMEARYSLTKWLFLNAGIGISMYFDVTDHGAYERNTLRFGLTKAERDVFWGVTDDQIRFFNLSSRLSVQAKYKRIGLELEYDQMLTNILKPFDYRGIRKNKAIRYGDLNLKLSYFFRVAKKK